MKHGFGIFLAVIGILAAVAGHIWMGISIWQGSGAVIGILGLALPPISTMIMLGVSIYAGLWTPVILCLVGGGVFWLGEVLAKE